MYARQLLSVAFAATVYTACAPEHAAGGGDDSGVDSDGGDILRDGGEGTMTGDASKDATVRDGAPRYLCGDARRTAEEGCDDGNTAPGDGCSDVCAVEPGYECPRAGDRCVLNVVCGDSKIGPQEVCDDGNIIPGDGCSQDCRAVETYFSCVTPGLPCLSTVVCGDKHVVGSEGCDDGNVVSGDGCSALCALESGYACRVVGVPCRAASCGDGLRVDSEECDDGDTNASNGCDDHCRVSPGYACAGTPGGEDTCVATICGNQAVEGSEQCDDFDRDSESDTPYDGCYKCQREPTCTNAGCSSVCGDGIKFPNEACDDGNRRDGDGCSSSCVREAATVGYACTNETVGAQSLDLPIILRDLRGNDLPAIPAKDVGAGHPDFENKNTGEQGIVAYELGSDKKPVYAKPDGTSASTSTAANFYKWYHDAPQFNRTVVDKLTLTKVPADNSYVYDNSNFFPLDDKGFVAMGADVEPKRTNGHNFSFTSELRYWFSYKGGEKLDFRGDDDVWVFVNGKLAVDLGGVHGAANGSVTLTPTKATEFGLTVGNIYEVVVFQAERHTTASSYKLTLKGFDKVKTVCKSVCGDGIVTADEVCDDQVNDGTYGHCAPGCQDFGPSCGDGQVQAAAGEQCDEGLNTGAYGRCAPDCKHGPRCGDGNVDGMFGEQCDDTLNDGGYAECASMCLLGERCGDGARQGTEQCDDGNGVASDGCDNACFSAFVF